MQKERLRETETDEERDGMVSPGPLQIADENFTG
jgi:hypothetical protein